MNASTKCPPATNGAGQGQGQGQGEGLERPRYFPLQMVTADDLTQGQEYLRARLRRHNVALHGWGVVYGAEVKPVSRNGAVRAVKVLPGLILTPQGDEIEITDPVTIKVDREPTPGDNADGDNPWFSDVSMDRPVPDTRYLAVSYADLYSSPVHVLPSACDCSGTSPCEYARLRESYVFRLLDTLPDSHKDEPTINTRVDNTLKALGKAGTDPDRLRAVIDNIFGGQLPPVPKPVTDPWVVLAVIHFNGSLIDGIDPISRRRLVVSLAPFCWRPTVKNLKIDAVDATADPALGGGGTTATVELKLTGTGLVTVKDTGIGFLNNGDKYRVGSVTPGGTDNDTELKIVLSFDVITSTTVSTTSSESPQPGRIIVQREDGAVALTPEFTVKPPK